jgi:hypothetical protein
MAPARTAALFGVLLCLPTASALPLKETGTSVRRRFLGRLSGNLQLACIWLHGVSERKAQWLVQKLTVSDSVSAGSGTWASIDRSPENINFAPESRLGFLLLRQVRSALSRADRLSHRSNADAQNMETSCVSMSGVSSVSNFHRRRQ